MREIYRPHCWLDDGPCPNPCAAAHWQRVVYGVQDLHGPWRGWRLTSREIITPDRMRLPRELLRFLIARERANSRQLEMHSAQAHQARITNSTHRLSR